MNTGLPRPDYPRPQYVRREWLDLNGIWDFDFLAAIRAINEGLGEPVLAGDH